MLHVYSHRTQDRSKWFGSHQALRASREYTASIPSILPLTSNVTVKPKNKRARYQQISDSSDSSDMNDDSDNDSMNDQTREEQAENRKGVG